MSQDLFEHIKQKFGEETVTRDWFRDASIYTIADQILLARKEAGLSRKELAKKAGVYPKAIAKIENVDTSPSLETLIKVAEALDLSLRGSLVPLSELSLD
jgi:transcriptional regulator with XRE-family HTH domain